MLAAHAINYVMCNLTIYFEFLEKEIVGLAGPVKILSFTPAMDSDIIVLLLTTLDC